MTTLGTTQHLVLPPSVVGSAMILKHKLISKAVLETTAYALVRWASS